jgi:hypothetical protein
MNLDFSFVLPSRTIPCIDFPEISPAKNRLFLSGFSKPLFDL